ncbi:hypothetical protein JST99_00055 [Candidatus Dependentiae bacterium]|nr:hypothetical protein [Candidatus Dependentiae bacterium]
MLLVRICRSLLLLSIVGCLPLTAANTADLIIFSYNRPLQLYALLESVHRFIDGLHEIRVLYRSDDQHYYQAYQEVQKSFPSVQFTLQGKNPQADFKPLLLRTINASSSDYLLFAVDDIIVKDTIVIGECIEALQDTDAYGFYFRLGTNISQGYPTGNVPLPPLSPISASINSWCFSQGYDYWAYPNTLDMTLYRKGDILKQFAALPYYAPNSLEGNWHMRAADVMRRHGLCYTTSKIVNIPLNIVQKEWVTPNMNAYDASSLLQLFNDGYTLAIDDLHKIHNKSAHMDFAVRFIKRTLEQALYVYNQELAQ